ncbi:hypothetical protein DPMN_025592 [Dreissena polymorpha]|uniref:Uncharacterized protein n=1 Tax=Dreissena polymorpha TaxID=45954 RepID=A0A9D4RDG6_DREPO|nr:hypothetical protein DPMN_025592 [Dreissena polymorpha]
MIKKLAVNVLDSEIRNLMLAYKGSLGEKDCELDGAKQFLKNTSKLISVYRDKRSVHLLEDQRLKDLKEIQAWFNDWQTHSFCSKVKLEKDGENMSEQCRKDIQSTIIGFLQLCCTISHEISGWSVVPAMINFDPIENRFCQQRGKFNGLNTNPTALQYQQNANSVILGQSALSKKTNTWRLRSNSRNFKHSIK